MRDTAIRIDRPDLRLRWARLRVLLWRFRALPFLRAFLSSASRSRVVRRKFAGRWLTLDLARSDTHLLLWAQGERYVVERNLLRAMVEPGDTVVDVGANIGYIALLLADRIGGSGRLYCVEPVPENLAELRRTCELNDLRSTEILPIAAGDRDGKVRLAGGLNGTVRPDSGELEVDLRRLDSLPIEEPSFVKIDVEGFELSVVAGAFGWFGRFSPRFLVEIHPELVPQSEDQQRIVDLLREHGYSRLRAVRPARPSSALGILLARYFGVGELLETDHPETWIEASRAGGRTDPYWLLAERAP